MPPFIYPGLKRPYQLRFQKEYLNPNGQSLYDLFMYEINKMGGIGSAYEKINYELNSSNEIRIKKYLLKSNFCSRYIKENWYKLPAHLIAKNLGSSKTQILRRGRQLNLGKKKGCHSKLQSHIQEWGVILNTETGIYYPNGSEAARSTGANIRTFQDHIKKHGFYKSFIGHITKKRS